MTSVRLHVDAIVALLAASNLAAYVGEAPDDLSTPYVVLYPTPGFPVAESLKAPNSDIVVDFQLTCVGKTAEQALWLHDQARAAVDHVTPTVSGRTCWPIYADELPQPIRRDDQVNPPLFVAISRWSLRSTT
jgi:hypothetical protein